MTLRLLVDWSNPTHPLLAEPHAFIDVQADGAPLAPVAQSQGEREFELPVGTSTVQLNVSFRPQLGAVGLTPVQQHEVLRARQTYRVAPNGAELVPEDMLPMMQPHPLIDSKSLSNRHGALRAHVHTDFVDVQAFWRAYCATAHHNREVRNEYDQEHHVGTQLRALAYTGGNPLLWFASYPDTLAFAPSSEVSCLVFFRPANDEYTRLDQEHSMFRLNRFLLSPVSGAQEPHRADRFLGDYVWLRAGFEQAILESGRDLVLVQPWPSGTAFGDAVTNRLPNLASAIVRLLWAHGEIATGHLDVRLGRLGLSGYSAGGWALWHALRANISQVREVFAFDANGTHNNVSLAHRWFHSNADNRLRLSGGLSFAPAVGSGIGPNLQMAARVNDTSGRVSVMPSDPREYTNGSMPHWDYVTALHPGLRASGGARHQFAIFGSYPGIASPPNTTFLEQFLRLSGY